MKKHIAIFTGLIILMTGTLRARTRIIDNFNDYSTVNSFGGLNGTWINNPSDRTIGCSAEIVEGKSGRSLQLKYDIDSALDYLVNDTYILDYSEFNIIGLAEKVPHTASGGYYMLTGSADIRKFNYLIFYARGSETAGYTRRLKVELKTRNQTSSYIVDGITSRWRKIVIPLSVYNKIDDWTDIAEITIVIDETATDKEGIIFFDDFYFSTSPDETPLSELSGTGGVEEHTVPREDTDIFLGSEINMNYRYTPERGNELFHDEALTLEGQSGRLTGRLKAGLDSQEFGESAYMEYSDEYPYTSFNTETTELNVESVQLKVNGLSPAMNKLTVGNIWIGYSLYNISPFWGWKGISVKGNIGNYSHDTFLIKRPYNSFSIGNRSLYYIGNHRIKVTGLYNYRSAKLDISDRGPSSLQSETAGVIRPVSSEYSYVAGTLFRFFENRVNCELDYGFYRFDREAEADYSSWQYPVYSHEVSSGPQTDELYEAKLFFDGVLPGNKLLVSYRDTGDDFKPEYRQEPGLFEDIYGDQTGYNLRFIQWYNQYNVNLYVDDIKRKTDTDYYRRVLNYGVGYIGVKGMEVSLNKEIKRERYVNSSLGINKNEEVKSIIAEFEYSIVYPLTPGVRYPLTPKFTFREDKTDNRLIGEEFVKHTYQLDVNFRLETDFGFSGSYIVTRYGASSDDAGEDLNDNALNVYFNLRF